MGKLRIIFEPGNSIVRDCGKYCIKIIDIKIWMAQGIALQIVR